MLTRFSIYIIFQRVMYNDTPHRDFFACVRESNQEFVNGSGWVYRDDGPVDVPFDGVVILPAWVQYRRLDIFMQPNMIKDSVLKNAFTILTFFKVDRLWLILTFFKVWSTMFTVYCCTIFDQWCEKINFFYPWSDKGLQAQS